MLTLYIYIYIAGARGGELYIYMYVYSGSNWGGELFDDDVDSRYIYVYK